MNKRKLIVTLLASACVTAGAFGLAACDGCNDDNTSDNRDTQIVAVYNLYAENARANGDTVLTYDEWLKSIKGENGKDGTNGEDGKSAYEIAVEHGFKGTEAEWLASLKGSDGSSGNGTDGKSAYEIAVEHGFKGTEAEWLASLKGADGEDGTDGEDGGKGDTGVSVVSVKQVSDEWGICSYFVFTMSDDSTMDTSATPMINVNRDKEYLVKNDTEKQLLISYGVMEDRIQVRPIIGVETSKYVVYTDDNDNFMHRVCIYEVMDEHSSTSVSLAQVKEYGGKVDISQVKIDTVGEYTVTGEYRGFEFELIIKVAQRVLVGVEGQNNPVNILEIQNEGIQQAMMNNCWLSLNYDDGSGNGVNLDTLVYDGAQIDFESIPANDIGIYQVDGSYKGFEFTINLIVYDSEDQTHAVIGILPQNSNSYWAGTDASEILKSWYTVYFRNGEQQGIRLEDMGVTLDSVDLTTPGEKTVSFVYEEFNCEIKFELKAVELLHTFTGTDTASQFAYAGTPVTEIKVYSNDSVKLTLSGEAQPVEAECDMGEGLIMISDEELALLLIYKYDEENSVFTVPDVSEIVEAFEMEEGETYTGTIDEKAVSLKLYVAEESDNASSGLAAYTVDGNTYLMMYMQQDNMLMLMGVEGMFKVNTENSTIAPMEMTDLG